LYGPAEIRTQDLRHVKTRYHRQLVHNIDLQNPHNGGGFGNNLTELNLTYSKPELDDYTNARSRNISNKSLHWIKKSSEIFWRDTLGTISQNTLGTFHNQITTQYKSHDSWSKVLNFAKTFLKYLSKLYLDLRYQNFSLFLETPRTRRDRKTVTSRIVTKEDITNVIDSLIAAYHNQRLSFKSTVNYIGITLFGAYTGQRIESTLSKLTVRQVRDALQTSPPIIHVNPNQDKIRMEHYVPLHPDLREILMQLVSGKDDDASVFEYIGYQMWLKHHPSYLSRVPTKRFTPSDLRKFAEQYGDIIQWDQNNRAYILTHGVSGVDWSHYKHPLPEYVYANYMQYWGSVHLLEKEIPREITRMNGLKVAQPSAGLSTA
jgi:hypothetical protein